MRWPDKLKMRLRSLFRRRNSEADLDGELRDHFEQEIAENIRAGMTPEEAKFAAQRLIGSISLFNEECRDAWGDKHRGYFIRDLRYAIRMLGRTPLFTAAAIITLALGIGANTTVFTFLEDEIGIRMALGAQPVEVLSAVFGRTMTLCAVGLTIGTLITLVAGKLLFAILYGVSPYDPITYLIALLLMAAVALAASWNPTHRAIHIDPAITLREQ